MKSLLDRDLVKGNILDKIGDHKERLEILERLVWESGAGEGGQAVAEGPDIDLVYSGGTAVVGRGGDTVLLFDSGGAPVAEYAATSAGVLAAAAAAAAGSGDMVQIPSVSITLGSTLTIASGVTLCGFTRYSSLITGDIVVNGFMKHIGVIGHVTVQSSGAAQYCWITSTTGNLLTVSYGQAQNCDIACQTGCDYGIYATSPGVPGEKVAVEYCRTYRYTVTSTGFTGVYADGDKVRMLFCDFIGDNGGEILTVEYIHACYFLGMNGDGLIHASGTAQITGSAFISEAGGVGADLDAAITMGSVNWDTITGESWITWLPPDDGSGGGGSLTIFGAETGNTSEIERQLIVGGESGGVLEGFRLVGYNDTANPVIAVGAGGASDEAIREIGNVLYEPNETTRKYKTLYTGYSGEYEGAGANEKIHYAYSEDGITWTKYASNPVIAARAEDPYLVRRSGIYYVYFEDKANQGANGKIRRYKSVDCMTWTDEGQITGLGDCQSPTVWIEGDTWYLLYERWPDPGNEDVMLATSTDGLAWTPEASNPVFLDSDTTWGNGAFVPDDIWKVGPTYYMSYHGYNGASYQAAMAKSTNLTAWTDLGIVTTTAAGDFVHLQIFYDTRFTFLYYLSDSSGIYRGYPVVPILTIAGGEITSLSDWYILAAQAGVTDDLDTINGGVYGQFLLIEPDAGDTITVKHGTGNIYLSGAADIVMSGNDSLLLHFDGTVWSDVHEASGGHAAVTLDVDAAVILDLTGQEIGLDTQTANTVFAGPASGAANEPTFRALVAADLPSSMHEHIVNEDHTTDCNGVETGFTTLLEFRKNSTQVFLNGLRQRINTDYTEDGTLDGIAFTTAPETGDILIIDYICLLSDYNAIEALLLETSDYLLTETGNHLLLE